MTTDVKVSRGYWSIKEVVDRLKPLAQWYEQHKPNVRQITTDGSDYDLIARWQKAAEQLGFTVTKEGVMFGIYTLKRDNAPARYPREAA